MQKPNAKNLTMIFFNDNILHILNKVRFEMCIKINSQYQNFNKENNAVWMLYSVVGYGFLKGFLKVTDIRHIKLKISKVVLCFF